ncbi:MAG: hypothetical protein D6734_08955 [Candidatus Schekmanbacteria bacterium]|nr:MAG: hypothetical protein D6734_08955 [Candidatus Schekmanbacteria bacterium]
MGLFKKSNEEDILASFDIRITEDLTNDLLKIIQNSDADQILVTSSRGKQLEKLAKESKRIIQTESKFQYELTLITGEYADDWKENLFRISNEIKDNPNKKRLIFAQGIRPPFTDLFSLTNFPFKAAVIRTDLTGYNRMKEVALMINQPGKAEGSFHCLVPVKEQCDITTSEKDRLMKSRKTNIIKELIKISHSLEEYFEKDFTKIFVKRNQNNLREMSLKLKRQSFSEEEMDSLLEAIATVINWEEGYMYWIRKDSKGKYKYHVACDRDGIAIEEKFFSNENINIMIAVKHGVHLPGYTKLYNIAIEKLM